MRKRQLVCLILILSLSLCGCRSIYVGGSGNIGGVSGSGGVSIPVPDRD